jgi:Domain of unknown function (DUF4349)
MNTSVQRPARMVGATCPECASGAFRDRGMRKRITTAFCAVLLSGTGLLVVGCSGSGSNSFASGSPAMRHEPAAPRPGVVNGAGASGAERTASGFSGSGQASTIRVTRSGQSIIYTANLTVQVRDAAMAAARAASDVSAAGGYTAAEKALTSHSPRQRPTVSLTLKVPVAGYRTALQQLSGLGRQSALSQQSTDVTQEVADVGSRVTSQRDEITQLRALLRRAGSVSGLLSVQEQLSNDESALESLLAQQRALDHETTYATISMLLLGPRPHVAAHRAARHGFAAGLAAGWHGLGHATSWALTALGVVLPFAVILAIIGGLGWAARRRIAAHRAGPTATS